MSRSPVSVVMPFAGSAESRQVAADTLAGLSAGPDDELILADNSGLGRFARQGVRVVAAAGERSPAAARNAGAAVAANAWILFLDADCRAPAGLLDEFLGAPIPSDVGAVSGGIRPAAGARTLAARYASARNPLGPRAHLAHPYLPRAPAANLLVRTEAFHALHGFREGLRAAEDTDFCWRLQESGWRLELRAQATVEHVYRDSLGALRRQWREYAAGRAWLAAHHPGYHPEPAIARALRGRGRRSASIPEATIDSAPPTSSRDRALFTMIDLLLAVEELRGLREANRPGPQR